MLEDLLAPDLALVVCGSAAGRRSAQLGHYYAGPGNKFWRTLAAIGLTPRQLAPSEYRQLLGFGIGLTDLVKRQAGADRDIDFHARAARELERKLERFRPGLLCFNGKRAAGEFLGRRPIELGLQPESVAGVRLFVAPSTSAAANAFWHPEVWQQLADLVLRSESPR
jgi:TDG/mug DNA glycosylase family protein